MVRVMKKHHQLPSALILNGKNELKNTMVPLLMYVLICVFPEQVYLNIYCPDGGAGGSPGLKFTHEETGPTGMLSMLATLTPWSDYNQSPRNMYQCQMAKQTMGTPLLAHPHRLDNKLYRIQTPQSPIARTSIYKV